jgi:hypothetical protein
MRAEKCVARGVDGLTIASEFSLPESTRCAPRRLDKPWCHCGPPQQTLLASHAKWRQTGELRDALEKRVAVVIP